MSTAEKLIKARMGMLALAEQLNNVSAACRRAGISRSHYYEIKEAFEKFGSEGWLRRPGGSPACRIKLHPSWKHRSWR